MTDYQLTASGTVIHVSTGKAIPADVKNRHHREYLAWVAAGGVPLPAPEPESDTELEEQRAAAMQKVRDTAGLSDAELFALFGGPSPEE